MPSKSKYTPSKMETCIGIGILVLLLIIAGVIYWKQNHYNKKKFNLAIPSSGITEKETSVPVPISTTSTANALPLGFQKMGEPEMFDEKTLSDKIDGKADLYLDCGFKKLECQKYVSSKDPKMWYEVYTYDMGNSRNAFAVYSNQRRPDSKDISISPFGYKTENAIFFIQGKYYLEIIASQANPTLISTLQEVGKQFISMNKGVSLDLPEVQYFPKENLLKSTYKIYLKNGFSFDKLNQVVVVNYNISGTTTMAFVVVKNTPEEAQKLAKEYYDFLLGMGSDKVDPGESKIPGLKMVDLVGDTELIFVEGKVLAGIHSAKNQAVGKKLADSLYQNISKQEHGNNSGR